jgi:TPR repeat protein
LVSPQTSNRRSPGIAQRPTTAARQRSELSEISIAAAVRVALIRRTAVAWYRRAADGDDLRAQYQLGQIYFDGTGVTRDYVSAYVWFDVAARQTPLVDNQKAILELRNIAAARMTPEQVEDAARRAKAWQPTNN